MPAHETREEKSDPHKVLPLRAPQRCRDNEVYGGEEVRGVDGEEVPGEEVRGEEVRGVDGEEGPKGRVIEEVHAESGPPGF